VIVTDVPFVYSAAQVAPQSIPAGELVTVPEPEPVFVTLNVRSATKFAVTVLSSFMVTVQEPVPEQAPDQPSNTEPTAGVAVRVTEVPLA
jgi:hypothetical protein